MKKFMTVCAIVAAAMIAVGSITGMIVRYIQGPRAISNLVESVTNGKLHLNLGNDAKWGVSFGEEGSDDNFGIFKWIDSTEITINDNTEFNRDYPILSGDVSDDFDADEIESLDIEMGACEMHLKASTDRDFHMEAENAGKIQSYVQDATLSIKVISKTEISGKNHCKVTLYVPDGFRFGDVEIELGAGALSFEKMAAQDVEIEVGAGEIKGLGLLDARNLELDIGAGAIELAEANVGKLEAKVGMGAMLMKGSVNESAELDCSMGSIKMELDGSERDFNYNTGSAMGNVQVGNYSTKGLASGKRIDNNADKDITLECSMGSIEISFTN